TWVAVDADGPQSLTLSWRLRGLEHPSDIAERLPKVLIHRNVPGEPVHAVLERLDDAWQRSAAHASFGARQRFVTTASVLRDEGLGVVGGLSRWRLGELTIRWAEVAPGSH
ncbi:MAG: class I SAM-dependent methyltransferase, partial [Nostocoides sp.]